MKTIISSVVLMTSLTSFAAEDTKLFCGIENSTERLTENVFWLSDNKPEVLSAEGVQLTVSRSETGEFKLSLQVDRNVPVERTSRSSEIDVKTEVSGVEYEGFCEYAISNPAN